MLDDNWMTIFDRYFQVFFLYSYPKVEQKVIASLLVLHVTVSVLATVAMFLLNAIDFPIDFPRCVLTTSFKVMLY